MLSSICPNSNCGNSIPMVNMENVSCNKCDFKLKEEFIMNYKEIMEFTEMQLQNMKDITCILFNQIIKVQLTI